MQAKLKCAIYTRVSTDNQAEVEFNSCEAQEAKIKSFIASQENMEVFRVYSDPGFTGANLNRPALQEILEDVRQKKINLVISYKIDRLTRSPRDFYQLIELFDKYGVDFISVTERFDTSTPSGRLLRNIMLTFAQFERELTSERTKDKMLERAKKGLCSGGLTPFGYMRENKKLIPHPKNKEEIKIIFETYIKTGSLSEVYKMMKKKGIKNKHENNFSKTSIAHILRNIVYIGKITHNSEIYQGIHEPIISEETFNLAQDIHKKKARKTRLYKNYSFAGLIKCGECGSIMTPCHTNKKNKFKNKRYYYYRCTSTLRYDWNNCSTKQVSADRLEKYIFDNLERIAIDKQYLDGLAFCLNSGVSGGLSGFELSSESPKISPEIVSHNLTHLTKTFFQKRGIDKNIFVNKFIKDIIYSPS